MKRRILNVFGLLFAALVIALLSAGFACLFPFRVKADTFGQVIWGQQQNTSSAKIVIQDPSATNVQVGTLDTVAHSFVPVLPLVFPSGITYPNPIFTGTVNLPTGQILNSPVLTGIPVAPTAAAGDNSTQIATTAFVRASALCQNATQLGFVGDGSTDNLAAWNTWVAAQGSSSACIYFPASANAYRFTATATANLAASQVISIYGGGPGATEWWFPNTGNGFTFTFTETSPAWLTGSAINLYDGTISTSQTGTGDAINLSGNGVVGQVSKSKLFQNIVMRGHISTAYWTTGINVQGVQGIYADTITVTGKDGVFNLGTGILFHGVDATNQALALYVTNSKLTFLNDAVKATGPYQGVYLSNLQIEGVTRGITCGDGDVNASQCIISGSAIEAARGAIILDMPGTANVIGNTIIQGVRAGAVTTDFMISLTSSPETVISGNTLFGTTIGGGGLPSCVDVSNGSGSSGTSISGNGFNACTTTVKYSASSANIASVGNAITGTPSYPGFVCGTSGNVIMDAGTPAQVCSALSSTLFTDVGAIPAISSCGSGSPSIAAGSTNGFGAFTTGTGSPTACTLTLASPSWGTRTTCIVQNQSAATPTGSAIVTGASVAVTFSAAANSQQFGYICRGQ